MIGTWWWPLAFYVLDTSPVQGVRVQLVQVVEVVSSVATSEDVDLVFEAVSCVHVAWARWLPGELIVQPFELLEVQDVHVVSSEWALS